MAGWNVAVLPVSEERFSVVLTDEHGRVMKAPDMAPDRKGYDEAALVDVLRHRYGVPGEQARAMIAAADRTRPHATRV
jgi:hypothetical protein